VVDNKGVGRAGAGVSIVVPIASSFSSMCWLVALLSIHLIHITTKFIRSILVFQYMPLAIIISFKTGHPTHMMFESTKRLLQGCVNLRSWPQGWGGSRCLGFSHIKVAVQIIAVEKKRVN